MFNISEIQIRFTKSKDGVIAYASMVLNGGIFIGGIAIHERPDSRGYRITYPMKGTFHIYHPINPMCSKLIEEAVISKLKDVMNRAANVRYRGPKN